MAVRISARALGITLRHSGEVPPLLPGRLTVLTGLPKAVLSQTAGVGRRRSSELLVLPLLFWREAEEGGRCRRKGGREEGVGGEGGGRRRAGSGDQSCLSVCVHFQPLMCS